MPSHVIFAMFPRKLDLTVHAQIVKLFFLENMKKKNFKVWSIEFLTQLPSINIGY